MSNGVALLNLPSLPVGTHDITAMYSGDQDNAATKASDTLEQTVTGTFNLTVSASAGSSTHTTLVPASLQ